MWENLKECKTCNENAYDEGLELCIVCVLNDNMADMKTGVDLCTNCVKIPHKICDNDLCLCPCKED